MFESNGPEVKIRGTAQQVLERYLALARDASSAGEHIAAEGYFQHAEHYYRILHADSHFGHGRGNGQGQQPGTPSSPQPGSGEAPAPGPASAEGGNVGPGPEPASS